MKRFVVFIFCCVMYSLGMYAQASGGQIRRSQHSTNSSATSKKRGQPQKYLPVDMEPYTYYMCINETWVVKNGQDLCRKMAAKGYKVELIKNPDPKFGYHVSVYKTTNKESAINFAKSFKDERWSISYVYYNREFLYDFMSDITKNSTSSETSPESPASNIQPTSIGSLPMYNVVVSNFNILSNAQMECQKLRKIGYFSCIYYNGQLYRVIIEGSNILDMARIQRKNAAESHPGAFILYFENGQEKRIN